MHNPSAYIVTDLGFGDSGKGTIVDTLTREINPSLIVRYNGGCQAAHTVVTPEGQTHTFHIFGSGTLSSECPTYLSKYVILHPVIMWQEAQELGGSHMLERLLVNPGCLINTTYHSAVNRIRELIRGHKKHGSCGIGIGETVQDSLDHPATVIKAWDCKDKSVLEKKLYAHWKLKLTQANQLCEGYMGSDPMIDKELALLNSPEEFAALLDLCHKIFNTVHFTTNIVLRSMDGPIIFEGAQGVLLDEKWGFPPYYTWSNCTADNAVEILKDQGFLRSQYVKLGVIRAIMTRHGAGPFPSFNKYMDEQLKDHYNPHNPWQGSIRFGHLDTTLLGYAVQANKGIDGLAVTCMDHLDSYYHTDRCSIGSAYNAHVTAERLMELKEELHDEEMTRRMMSFTSDTRSLNRIDFLPTLSQITGAPVWITGHGPRTDQKIIAEGMPRPSICNSVCVH